MSRTFSGKEKSPALKSSSRESMCLSSSLTSSGSRIDRDESHDSRTFVHARREIVSSGALRETW